MAPEVYLGKPYNNTVDIYSLGIVMYKLLNRNRAPFLPDYPNPVKYSDRESAMKKRIGGDKLPVIKDVPVGINEIIQKACAFSPKDRYQSADEMKQALIETLDLSVENVNININHNGVSKAESLNDKLTVENTFGSDETVSPFNGLQREELFDTPNGIDKAFTINDDATVSGVSLKNEYSAKGKNKSDSKKAGSILTKLNIVICIIALLLETAIDIFCLISQQYYYTKYIYIKFNLFLTIAFYLVLIIGLVRSLVKKNLPLSSKIIILFWQAL